MPDKRQQPGRKSAGIGRGIWIFLAVVLLLPLLAVPLVLIFVAIRDAPPANGIPFSKTVTVEEMRGYAAELLRQRGIAAEQLRLRIAGSEIIVEADEIRSAQGTVNDLRLRGTVYAERGKIRWRISEAVGRGVTLPAGVLEGILSDGVHELCCSNLYVQAARIESGEVVLEGLQRP